MSTDHEFENPSHPRAGEHVRLIGGPKGGWTIAWPEPLFLIRPPIYTVASDYEVQGQDPDGTWVAYWQGTRDLPPPSIGEPEREAKE